MPISYFRNGPGLHVQHWSTCLPVVRHLEIQWCPRIAIGRVFCLVRLKKAPYLQTWTYMLKYDFGPSKWYPNRQIDRFFRDFPTDCRCFDDPAHLVRDHFATSRSKSCAWNLRTQPVAFAAWAVGFESQWSYCPFLVVSDWITWQLDSRIQNWLEVTKPPFLAVLLDTVGRSIEFPTQRRGHSGGRQPVGVYKLPGFSWRSAICLMLVVVGRYHDYIYSKSSHQI